MTAKEANLTQHELKRTITVVEVPKRAEIRGIEGDYLYFKREIPVYGFIGGAIKLNGFDWSILSTDKEMTEKKADKIMFGLSTGQLDGVWYSFIKGDTYSFDTALDSYKSFMQSHNYTNPDKQYLILVKD